MKKQNECGHPERPHKAKGMCSICYSQSPARKNYHNKYQSSARGKKAHNNRQKAYLKTFKGAARSYATRLDCSFEDALLFYQIEEKDRICWMCKTKGTNLHLDHNHKTKKIRGWSHRVCNMAEGAVKASPNPKTLLRTLLEGEEE